MGRRHPRPERHKKSAFTSVEGRTQRADPNQRIRHLPNVRNKAMEGQIHHGDLLSSVDKNGVATLTLNRSDKHNAFDADLIQQLMKYQRQCLLIASASLFWNPMENFL